MIHNMLPKFTKILSHEKLEPYGILFFYFCNSFNNKNAGVKQYSKKLCSVVMFSCSFLFLFFMFLFFIIALAFIPKLS